MKIPLLSIGLLAYACSVSAQNITKVTSLVVHSGQTNEIGQTVHGNATNTFSIPLGEAARISSIKHLTYGDTDLNFANMYFLRDGWYWDAFDGDVVEGPVTFIIELTADSISTARMTLERFKVAKK